MGLLDGDLARAINAAAGGIMLRATLTSVTPGERVPGRLAHGTEPTTTTHACRGMVSDYLERQIDGEVVRIGDRRILLLGASIAGAAVPKPGDLITIQGAMYTIVAGGVRSDPASATYECQVRR